MILDASIYEKSFGSKELFRDIYFSVEDGEKIGMVGRNGIGKSTILKIISGQDTDFTGDIIWRRGASLVTTDQEYADVKPETTVTEYILSQIPEYQNLHKIITEFPEIDPNDEDYYKKLDEYSNALQRFSDKGFYEIEQKIAQELTNFQLENFATRPFVSLSGGQKRLTEVVKIMHSDANLAIIDEPTNFMDYEAKSQFIDWAKSTKTALIIITHDRDVLETVNKIIEIKDGQSQIYDGNYAQYLSQNASLTSNSMNQYEITQNKIKNLKKQIAYAKAKKPAWSGTADKKNPFVVMEERLKRQLKELEKIEKPSFWVDKSSVENMNYKDAGRYEKYKTKNIRIGLKSGDNKSKKSLIKVEKLSLGYLETPLFANVNFEIFEGGTLELRGRNGAGKSTIVKAIISRVDASPVQLFDGTIKVDEHMRVGIYEQEVGKDLFDKSLHDAIEFVHLSQKVNITETKIRQLMDSYLFTPDDLGTPVRNLSGGQKARLQIIKMLANDPNILILDEPTSHLDLPSIEELETALGKYSGAILYISHDGYFRNNLGGEVIQVG
ncbi:MAG: ATP-binding cassette domain-containing protein [Candidatus Nomurabacteria bacterium]|jgi:ATPase subunit of ABC transporter with duplicated ATPase domains|nr:ATP-binding cassette domain-containing protein [Candidatus Nomurabacteria bacterium]